MIFILVPNHAKMHFMIVIHSISKKCNDQKYFSKNYMPIHVNGWPCDSLAQLAVCSHSNRQALNWLPVSPQFFPPLFVARVGPYQGPRASKHARFLGSSVVLARKIKNGKMSKVNFASWWLSWRARTVSSRGTGFKSSQATICFLPLWQTQPFYFVLLYF